MADNVAVTAGSGTTIAADEVSDGTLGSVKVQFVKLMDGTLDGTTKAAVGANGLKVDGSGTTQPISAASLPLPTGAATAAKQPALGTAGSASADVITVQGIASGTAQPISAASLPLPSGAATAAKQPALGTAGTPSADVLTIQGAASMTSLKTVLYNSSGTEIDFTATSPVTGSGTAGTAAAGVLTVQGIASMVALKVDGSAVTQPVSGTVSITDLSSAEYETVAASQTDQVLGATGASGDYLAGLLIVPATAAAGAVSIKDGSGSSITVFAGGGTTALPTLAPIPVPLGMKSTGGAWKVTTGSNVSVIGIGNFT